MNRAVVLVHGTRTSSDAWRAQVRALTARGHDVVAVDLPGHGRRRDERFDVRRALEVVGEAVDAMPSAPVLVGASLGGYLSAAFAGSRPRDVAGLVLSGCSAEIRGKPVAAFRALAHHANGLLRVGGPTWHVVTDVLRGMTGYSVLRDLRRLDLPVWVVNGARDPLRIDERRLVRALRHGELHVVPRAGHDVNLHAPEAFNALLLRAVEGPDAAARDVRPSSVAGA